MNITSLEKLLNQMPESIAEKKPNTIAHIFNRDYAENFLSDWLCFILDPQKINSSEPINTLLSLVPGTKGGISHEEVDIQREHTFPCGRRIDFLISTNQLVIGIENKIWSGEGHEQLQDYWQALNKIANRDGKEAIAILLKPKGNQIQPGHGFIEVTYETLVEAFKSIRIDFIGHLREAFLLQDFIDHMEGYILENDYSISEATSFIHKNAEQLKRMHAMVDTEIARFVTHMKKRVSALADEDGWIVREQAKGIFIQLYKESWAPYGIHYELVNTEQDMNIFPKYYMLVLHCEGRKAVQKEFGSIIDHAYSTMKLRKFPLDFSSTKALDTSIDAAIEALGMMKIKYTPEIDRFVTGLILFHD